MKKLFFLAATMIAAISANAWNGFDYTSTKMYTVPIDQIFTNMVNCSAVQTAAPAEGDVTGKNSINLTTGGTEASFTMGDVKWTYTNSADGTTIAKQYANYVQPNGKDRVITIPTAAGDQVLINVVEAIGATGVSVTGIATDFAGFVAGDNVFMATGNIVITTSSEKPKFSAIKPYSGTGLRDAAADARLNKKIVNGRMFVRNAHGEWMNILGY